MEEGGEGNGGGGKIISEEERVRKRGGGGDWEKVTDISSKTSRITNIIFNQMSEDSHHPGSQRQISFLGLSCSTGGDVSLVDRPHRVVSNWNCRQPNCVRVWANDVSP